MPCSYLVMPFMQTDLQKIMGMEFSEDKIQYLVYQMLKGLKVGRGLKTAEGGTLMLRPEVWGRPVLGGRESTVTGWRGFLSQPETPSMQTQGARLTLVSLQHSTSTQLGSSTG